MIHRVLEHYGADLARVQEHGWRSVRCPFHPDRTASARVNLEKGGFICLACGVHGDAIGLIKDREGLGYLGAVEFAKGLGVHVEHRSSSREEPRRASKWRETLFS